MFVHYSTVYRLLNQYGSYFILIASNRNHGFRTIEDDLMTALWKADLVPEEGCTCPKTVNFQRAARTDKGVSAARQVVSVKLCEYNN